MRGTMSRHLEIMLGSLATKPACTNHPDTLLPLRRPANFRHPGKTPGPRAPTKLSLIDPTQEQIEEFLNDKIGPRSTDEEADIFDVEV